MATSSSPSTTIVSSRELFGEFDQNLAMIEQRLGVDAVARGNQVTLRGDTEALARARLALDMLYGRLQEGHSLAQGDVDGAIRMATAAEAQLSLPTLEPRGRLTMAQIATRRRTVMARTPMQDAYIRAFERAELIFGIGPAGTGKTYLAVAHAAAMLERGAVDRLILSRPAVEAGERLGFLPGDMKEKVDPYLRPLYDALYDMMPPDKVERGFQSGIIEVAPLAFMRGRTLANAVVILDEAQNTTSMQMKMFLTRLGENSRMIVTGDPSQIDLPRGQVSGLVEAVDLLKDVDGIAQVRFTAADVVRHPLVARIVEAYDNAERRAGLGDLILPGPSHRPAIVADILMEGGDWPPEAELQAAGRSGDRRLRGRRRPAADRRRGRGFAGFHRRRPCSRAEPAYRGRDRPTNVLSFPAAPLVSGRFGPPLGDIVLARETVVAEAAAEGLTVADHLSHLIVHGFLHLLGHDHEKDDEAAVMERLETAILGRSRHRRSLRGNRSRWPRRRNSGKWTTLPKQP